MFVRNKIITETFFTLIWIYIDSSCEKNNLLRIRKEICTDQEQFTSKTVQNKYVGNLRWEDNRGWTFSLEEALLWIMDLYFVQKWWFKVKTSYWYICFIQIHRFSLHKTLTDGLEWCGLLWCLNQLFGLPFWRHPFTPEDPLVNKLCIARFFHEETTSSISLDGLRVNTF